MAKRPLRQPIPFDSDVPEGVDPDALHRHTNRDKAARVGSTPAQRAGQDPDYTPGYGSSSPANSRTYAWTDFDSVLAPRMGANRPPLSKNLIGSNVTAAAPAPLTPPPARPAIKTMANDPSYTAKTVAGLPRGQYARSNFRPGQNTPPNLARRNRIDPYG